MTQIVMPGHTNSSSNVLFGGLLMQWIDVCAGVAAMRHTGGPVVTASIDRVDFIVPVKLGCIVELEAQVNFVHKTSMEVGCRVHAETPDTRTKRYTTKAYLTFVAIDNDGRPRAAPALTLATDDDRRRCDEARQRRAARLRAAGRTP